MTERYFFNDHRILVQHTSGTGSQDEYTFSGAKVRWFQGNCMGKMHYLGGYPEGEKVIFRNNGTLRERYFVHANGSFRHGEMRVTRAEGTTTYVKFYKYNSNITNSIKKRVKDINNLTYEEKKMIFIRYGLLTCEDYDGTIQL